LKIVHFPSGGGPLFFRVLQFNHVVSVDINHESSQATTWKSNPARFPAYIKSFRLAWASALPPRPEGPPIHSVSAM
jgi:hypothetical protein